ncbi:MAG: WD40/YVTN/BNR-like repeat-containing protein [Steroidobacteraceae bacterium]
MRVRIGVMLVLGAAVAALACAADSTPPVTAAAAVPRADYQALHWRLIGPFRAGRVLAVTGIPGNGRVFYFGSVDGGVWKSVDAGRTWQPIFDHEPVGSIGAIAVAPSDRKVLYVGTGEADMRSDIAQGDGMYKSVDGGRHWQHIGLTQTRQIASVIVNPTNPNVVFAAALGHPYGANPERGVFRSLDGGRHWQKVLYLNANTGADDVVFKPGDPQTVYAALWQTRRPPWSVYPPSDGPGSGLYVSHDGGSHWTHITGNGFPAHPGRIGLAVAPTEPNLLYALVDGNWRTGGLYRSEDGGAHWQHVSRDRRIFTRCWYFCALTVDPSNAQRVYVMDTIVLRSDDGGAHFIALKGDPTGDDFHQLWIDPTDPARMILGSDQGTQVTLDGGKTWSSWYNQPTAQIYHISVDNRFPFWVYGSQQDSGALALPSRTISNDGITLEQFREITPGGENGNVVPDPRNPNIIYGDGTGESTTVRRLDLRTGQVRDVDPTLDYPDAHYRTDWTLPLVFSPYDHKTLYFANQYLFSTADGGRHWMRISPDLSRKDPGVPPNVGAVTARDSIDVGQRRGVIYSIAPSRFSTRVIWVGTDDGLVWRTADGGAHWVNVTPKALTPWSKVAGIELSYFHRRTAYLAVDRHRLDDERPYIYVTHDNGRTWRLITAGIPRHDFVNVVREDPRRPGLLYAGTEYGVFVSFDGGTHWQSLQQNLPVSSVRDLKIHDDDLVLATHGRGIWIMDDISALRQMGAVRPGAVTLFKPAAAIRLRPAGFTGTPFPKDEPMAANPPDGAYIDYLLPAGVTGPVSITIRDAQGREVRHYSSAEHVAPPNAATLDYAPVWASRPAIPSAAPGMHRLVWDLHYARLGEHAAGTPQRPGVWAPPGRYSVELTVDGVTYRQALTVKPDPRVHVPQSALVSQFNLARKVERAQVRTAAAETAAVKLLDVLDLRLKGGGAQHAAIARLYASARSISGEWPFPQHRPAFGGGPPRNVKSLVLLSQDLTHLEQAVDDADAAPSPDARVAYRILSRQLDATLREWRDLLRAQVPKLNQQLKAAGEAPLAD